LGRGKKEIGLVILMAECVMCGTQTNGMYCNSCHKHIWGKPKEKCKSCNAPLKAMKKKLGW
jgi:RecJ-like exonuclease